SSTTCVIADSSGRTLGTGRGGPVDHLYLPAGRRRTRESLGEAISAAMRAARLRGPVRAVVAGLTGLEPYSPESLVATKIIHKLIRSDIVRATWDAEIALAGASGNGRGVVVIAGTGSVALGRNAEGRTARAGGYGYLIDDAGGGVSIGQSALRSAMRSLEGRREPETKLGLMLRTQLGEWPQMRRRVYGGDGRALLASLVPVVATAARHGDTTARRILQDAGQSLAELAIAVAANLGMLKKPFDLFPLGGVFAIGRPVMDPLRSTVLSRAPRCRIREPKYPPVIGAVLMALEAGQNLQFSAK
ncbi:MAG TPA: BadF/BadG/BcrA/BcrD ATPase family protein, partial [bacterium]|nr:BadF/BadG/BcrA/BcrD ATPase family protein [bacterium]